MRGVKGFEDEPITLNYFTCHKVVRAAKILAIHGNTLKLEGVRFKIEPKEPYLYFLKNPQVGGYFVVYEDGYESFSPAGAFESGYTLQKTIGDEG